jgi:hypothetical protein
MSAFSDGTCDPVAVHSELYGRVVKRYFWARQIATRDLAGLTPIMKEENARMKRENAKTLERMLLLSHQLLPFSAKLKEKGLWDSDDERNFKTLKQQLERPIREEGANADEDSQAKSGEELEEESSDMDDESEDGSDDGDVKKRKTKRRKASITLFDLARAAAGINGTCEEEASGDTLSARATQKHATEDDAGRAYFGKYPSRLPNYL